MDTQRTEISSAFLEALTRLSRKLRTQFNARVVAHGLTYPRARALLRLADRAGMTQSELAFELELEKPTLVRLLDRMEALDLIRREADPKDRRAKLIILTAHGRTQAELVKGLGAELRHDYFSTLDTDALCDAVRLMEAVSARIDAHSQEDGDA
ncbi:MarR family transcriptional regulator [Paroceanicella profunda]|uniref:MarR family transcriptional regulator n=1 Tax=Paroceanicella profunda TaxID=2579971 RepID=A0A5B8FQR4_9RHOB|nr:MarR family transcriptional regulator [Paroceanicella profunda]QDL91016.1 MarR family transcriptional regulator [Paroceanicella profunda]